MTLHFHAGHNDAGYLPESDVSTFSNFDDARQYQIDELLRAADAIGSWSEPHDCDDCPCPTFGDDCPDQLASAVALEAESLNLETGPSWSTYLSDGRSLPVSWWIEPCREDDCEIWCEDCMTEHASGECAEAGEVEREVESERDRATILAYLDAEHPTFGNEVTVTGRFLEDLESALAAEHPCDDASCDIAAMVEHGYAFAAAHSLMSATDCEVTSGVVAWYVEHGTDADRLAIGTHLYDCPDWDGWKAHHDAHSVRCPECNGFTYGDDHRDPDRCGSCGADLAAPDFWSLLESPPVGCSHVAALWSWSLNHDAGKGPATLFLDLIGYSEDEYGQALYDLSAASLGFVEVRHLRDALSDYLADPHGVREFVGTLLAAEATL